MTQNEIVTAVAFAANFLESELPYPVAPNRLNEFEREIYYNIRALRALHRQLSPLDGRLQACCNGTAFKKPGKLYPDKQPAGEL